MRCCRGGTSSQSASIAPDLVTGQFVVTGAPSGCDPWDFNAMIAEAPLTVKPSSCRTEQCDSTLQSQADEFAPHARVSNSRFLLAASKIQSNEVVVSLAT